MPSYLDRLAEIAKRLTPGIGGEALHAVSPELMYVVGLEMDRLEMGALGGTRLWYAAGSVAASVGNFSSVLIGSGTQGLTVITHLLITAGVNAFFRVGAAPAGFAAIAGATYFRDSRLSGNPTTTIYSRQGTQLAVNSMALTSPLNQVFPWPGSVTATTGRTSNSLLYLEGMAANTAIGVYAFGYERIADAHELDATVQ